MKKILSVLLLFFVIYFTSYEMADAMMFRCISRAGEVVYTNVRNGDQCKALSLSENTYQTFPPASFAKKKNNNSYDSWIRLTAARYGVDYALIKAIISIESDFNHRAVSSKGARGLMQLMPQTAQELKVHNSFDPRQNIDGGTRYFRKMLDNFNGDISLSLAAYNAGPGLVKRVGSIPAIPETRDYVQKVLQMYQIYKNQP